MSDGRGMAPAAALSETQLSGPEPPLPWSTWLRYWAVVAVWMGVISYLSTDAFSASNTNRYIDPVLRFFLPWLSNRELLAAHTVVRKTAHLSEYCVLGLLAFWAGRGGRTPRWKARWMVQALVIAGLWAGIDELHQTFTADRTPSMYDSGIDFIGAAIGQLFVYVGHLWRSRRH